MKKLAPQGYQKTPAWQKRILENVLKRACYPLAAYPRQPAAAARGPEPAPGVLCTRACRAAWGPTWRVFGFSERSSTPSRPLPPPKPRPRAHSSRHQSHPTIRAPPRAPSRAILSAQV